MPLIRIYRCAVCDTGISTAFGAPVPSHCGAPAKWKQTRDYKPEEHGWETGMKSAAIDFRNTSPMQVPLGTDGMEVSSLRDIRRIERESEQRERNGEGEAYRFRAFSQNKSNMLQNTFGEPPQRKPQLFDKQGRQKISFELVDGEPQEVEMGPGAEEALASSLGPGMGLEP